MASTNMKGSSLPLRRWLRRAPLLVVSLMFAAAGVALVALFAVAVLSGAESPPPATSAAQHLVVGPDHIFDRPARELPPTPKPWPTVTAKPTASPTPVPTPAPAPAPPLPRSFTLIIPSIGVNAPVNPYGLDYNNIPEVPYNGYEVAWYDWSARPGTGGNAVLAGHVTWAGQGVFYWLNQVAAGDELILRHPDGSELHYVVDANFLVNPDDPGALSVMHPANEDMVTIITCGGDWYNDAGAQFGVDYTHRRVVQARFASSSPGQAVAAAGS